MNKITVAVAIALAATSIFGASPGLAQTSAARSYQNPDFAGRDKEYSYLRTKILDGMREGANFAGHFTIVRIGCGSGCSNNLLVDRRTGQIHSIPFGGEEQQMLTFRHNVGSNVLTAIWMDYEDCVSQEASWNGTGFEVRSSPGIMPQALCRS